MSQLGIATAGLDATGDDTYNTVVQYREEQASEFIRIYIFLLVYLKYLILFSYGLWFSMVSNQIILLQYNSLLWSPKYFFFFFHHEFLW